MAEAAVVRVEDIVGGARLGAANLQAWLLAALMLFVDAFNFAGLAVGSPAILESFSLRKEVMGLIFAAGPFGIVIGSLIFGYLADRMGRRNVAIAGTLVFSLSTLGTAFAGSAATLVVAAFVTGIGVGGVTPTAITYLTEWAPTRRRSAFVTSGLMAYPLGDATLATIGKEMIPHWGWQVVFFVPGLVGLVLCFVLFLAMRESLLYLAATQPEAPELRQRLLKLSPSLAIESGGRIAAERTPHVGKGCLARLVTGDLRMITPLLWAGYLLESLAFGSFYSWFQVMLINLGLSRGDAALALSICGGTRVIMILGLAVVLDRAGYRAGVALAATAAAAFVIMASGFVGPSAMLIVVAIIALAAGLTLHSVFNGTVGTFYPTPIRNRGIAFATSAGRVGQIIGPPIFGLALSSISEYGILSAVCLIYVVLIAICWLLYSLSRKIKET